MVSRAVTWLTLFLLFFAAPIVGDSPSAICEDCEKPKDVDSDGLYEDVNGDGILDSDDQNTLFNANLSGLETEYFDFNQDGALNSVDVLSLTEEYRDRSVCKIDNDDCKASENLDRDKFLEDINSDGVLSSEDINSLQKANFSNVEPEYFDFSRDGTINSTDALHLTNEYREKAACEIESNECIAAKDPDRDGKFEDINGDDTVDFDDLEAFFTSMDELPAEHFDINGDGEISYEDGSTLSNSISREEACSSEIADELMRKYDTDGSKELDDTEILPAIEDWRKEENISDLQISKMISKWQHNCSLDYQILNAELVKGTLSISDEVISRKEYQANLSVENPKNSEFEGQVNLDFEVENDRFPQGFSVTDSVEIDESSTEEINIKFTVDSPRGGEIPEGTVYSVQAELMRNTGEDSYGNPGHTQIDLSEQRNLKVITEEIDEKNIEMEVIPEKANVSEKILLKVVQQRESEKEFQGRLEIKHNRTYVFNKTGKIISDSFRLNNENIWFKGTGTYNFILKDYNSNILVKDKLKVVDKKDETVKNSSKKGDRRNESEEINSSNKSSQEESNEKEDKESNSSEEKSEEKNSSGNEGILRDLIQVVISIF